MHLYPASLSLFRLISILAVGLFLGACNSSGLNSELKSVATEREYPSPSGDEKAVVVFIHGIIGSFDYTFRSQLAQSDWPQMLAEDSTLNHPVRTLSLGYMSGPFKRASNIHEIATRLQTRLRDKNVFTAFDKVVFVTHSMGGLIVKEMILQLQRDEPSSFAKVAGVFFLATPSGGSELADTAKWLSGNPQFGDMRPEDFNTYLQTIEDEWQAMLRHRNSTAPYPKAFCVYEKLPVGPIVVVPRSRSQFGCDDREIAFDRNHIDLVKPANVQDEVYQYVATRIGRILEGEYVEFRISVSLLTTDGHRIPTNVALRSGDGYGLELTSTRPAWFVVFARDSRGRVERYFPSVAAGDQKGPSSSIRIPTDIRNAFVLDSNSGAEEIIVFASMRNKDDLRKLGAEVALAGSLAGDLLDDTLHKKGSRVAPVPKIKPAGDLQRIEAAGNGSDATVRLVFWHE